MTVERKLEDAINTLLKHQRAVMADAATINPNNPYRAADRPANGYYPNMSEVFVGIVQRICRHALIDDGVACPALAEAFQYAGKMVLEDYEQSKVRKLDAVEPVSEVHEEDEAA
jgi:hypothetical protein